MKRRLTGSACVLMATSAVFATAPNAFVGAQGFGATATGGRGGDVYHVTNLSDSGVGSLRYGIENAPAAGRTIVFDVGGWIVLNSKLGVTKSKITIAGQTAPGGIGLRNAQFSVGGDDIIIRHMRFRPGKITNTNHDSVNTNENAQRVIYDHISAEFSTDGGFDVQADQLTLQYSSVSFGLLTHSTGGLIQSPTGGAAGRLTFHHNVFAHNQTRNPKARAELIDWRDNVVYNFHDGFIAGSSETDVNPNWRANFDGNTYISNAGGNASSGGRPMMTGGRTQNYDLYYGVNALDRDSDSADDPIVYTMAQAQSNQSVVSSAYNWYATPFAAPEVWQNGSPAAAYEWTLQHFGATPWARDAVNALIASQVRSRTGQRISNENQLGIEDAGYPTLGGVAAPLDTDQDGMPDAWEKKHGLNPLVANNNADFDADGYTDLEEYLMDIAPMPAPGEININAAGGRYALAQNWTHLWQPSALDTANISAGTVIVDAVGQHAGTLRVIPAAAANASLVINAGWLEIENELSIGTPDGGNAAVRLTGGELRVDTISKTPAGSFEFTGGTLHANHVDFDLNLNGGTLSPGASVGTTEINGDLNISAGTVEIELATSSFADRVNVAGHANLGGTVSLGIVAPAVFTPYLRTTILSADAGVVGTFDSVVGLQPAAFSDHGFAVIYESNAVRVTLARLGDATLDQSVNFADLLVVAQNFEAGGTWNSGDFNGDGVTNFVDLLTLARHFDAAGVQGELAADFAANWTLARTLVPEPASLAIITAATVLLQCRVR